MNPDSSDLLTLLRDQFGHDRFRPGQERIIRSLLQGRDVLAVLPTGAGKSLVFQLTAQLLPGMTVVVSPLIALMKDQADSVAEVGLDVGVVNSAQPAAEAREAVEQAKEGDLKLLYVTPERLEREEFLEELRRGGVSLLAVDEAHCVSEWGFDFRPSYLRLREAARRLGSPPILALTATATPWVRSDLTERLGLRSPDVVVRDVDRPNLFFEVTRVQKEVEDYRVLRSLLFEASEEYPAPLRDRLLRLMQGSGIIYTATTKGAEETAGWLREWGIATDFYHGQRKKGDRERVQDAFMTGDLRVIAATNAFGLGVDKSDVRFVIHRDVPASVEAYYQEAGRAGRDGELARCTLIYRAADLGRAAFLSASSLLVPEEVQAVAERLKALGPVTTRELEKALERGRARVRRAVEVLKRAGLAEERAGKLELTGSVEDAAEVSLESEERRKAYERSRVQMMRGYAELWECRRKYLLNYFGEDTEWDRCGHCDIDVREASEPDAPVAAAPFTPGMRVSHAEWGAGTIIEAGEQTLAVRFDSGEERKLALDVVLKRNLLTPLGETRTPMTSGPEAPHRIGDRVTHPEYGAGEVQRITDNSITVLFESVGYRTLDANLAEEQELLRPI